MEAVIIVDILRRAGAKVVVASVESDTTIIASRNVKLVADTLISDTLDATFDLIILPVNPSLSIILIIVNFDDAYPIDSWCSAKNEIIYLKSLQGGMPGAEHLQRSESLTKILKEQAEAGRVLGAICAAPVVVFEANGLLEVMIYSFKFIFLLIFKFQI